MDYKLINKELRNIHEKDRCFLVGSGPSLNNFDLTKIKDEYMFVASFFCLHKDYNKFTNLYHSYSARFPCNTGKLIPKFYIKTRNNKHTTFFFDECVKPLINKFNYYPDNDIYYCTIDRTSKRTIYNGEPIQTDITKPLVASHTIMLDYNFPIANYMGFKEIYVIGCDSKDTKPYEVAPHFYDKRELPPQVGGMTERYTSGFNEKILNYCWNEFKNMFEKNGGIIYNVGDIGPKCLNKIKFEDIV